MSLISWNPSPALNMGQEFDRLFDGLWQRREGDAWPARGNAWYPAVDWVENDSAFELSAELPGMNRDDITVSVQRDAITIQGEKKAEWQNKEEGRSRFERTYGHFSRTFRLPAEIEAEQIEATYKDGVLKLVLPKAAQARTKQIEIKSS